MNFQHVQNFSKTKQTTIFIPSVNLNNNSLDANIWAVTLQMKPNENVILEILTNWNLQKTFLRALREIVLRAHYQAFLETMPKYSAIFGNSPKQYVKKSIFEDFPMPYTAVDPAIISAKYELQNWFSNFSCTFGAFWTHSVKHPQSMLLLTSEHHNAMIHDFCGMAWATEVGNEHLRRVLQGHTKVNRMQAGQSFYVWSTRLKWATWLFGERHFFGFSAWEVREK